MKPATNRFFSVTELVAHLLRFLNHKEISRLMRTSQQFHELCTPEFYSNIKAVYEFGNERNVLTSIHSTRALSRNIQHIRQLTLGPLEIVYYANCIYAYQEELCQVSDSTTKDPPRQLYFQQQQQLQLQPFWLPPPDPRDCVVLSIPPTTQLTELTFHVTYTRSIKPCPYLLPSFNDPKATLAYLCWIIDLNPCLLSIDLTRVILKDQRDVRLLTTSIASLKNLESLHLEVCEVSRWEMPPNLASSLFFCCPRSLKSLEIYLEKAYVNWYRLMSNEYLSKAPGEPQAWEKDEVECGLPMVPRRQEPLARLRWLELSGANENNMSESDIRSILAHCPNINDISFPNITQVKSIEQLAYDIGQICPTINTIQVDNYSITSRQLTLRMLGTLPQQQVKKIVWYSYNTFLDPELSNAGWLFRRHSKALQSIDVSGCHNIDSKAVQAILVECEVLERFTLHCGREITGKGFCIDLEDAIEFPWGCTRIQKLKLTIAIPDEPLHFLEEDTVPYYNRPAPIALTAAEKEQFKSLEILYRHIGTLTELRSLRLLALYYDPDNRRPVSGRSQFYTFPGMLSLGCEETGRPGYLSHFSKLTMLTRLFSTSSARTAETKATVGKDEVVWMERHWPALKKGSLVRSMTGKDLPEAFQWAKKRGPGYVIDI